MLIGSAHVCLPTCSVRKCVRKGCHVLVATLSLTLNKSSILCMPYLIFKNFLYDHMSISSIF